MTGRISRAAFATIPEMELLLLCARLELSADQLARLRVLVGAGLDWSRLVPLALRHKMLPLVWRHLKPEVELGRAPESAAMGQAFLANAGRMLRLSGELLELHHLLAAEGIEMVPYKGPALGVHLYGNVALRQAGDLDILVRRADAARARALLHGRGYRPRHALSQGGEEFMLRSRYSEELTRGGVNVELHWAFTNGDVALPLDLQQLAPRLTSTSLGGRSVPMFGHEDTLLILCVHGCKHRWDRLEWLCGVAELLRSHAAELDADLLVERAAALGVRRMLLLGVLLAHETLDAPAPGALVHLARSDRAVVRLAGEVPALLTAEPVDGDSAGSIATDLFRFQLRERRLDRLRFIWYRVTTPSRPESWAAVPLGRYWLPLHGFLRPFRLMAKLPLAIRQLVPVGRGRR